MDFYRLYKMLHANRFFWSLWILLLIFNLIVRMTVIQGQRNKISRQNQHYQELRSHWRPLAGDQGTSFMFEKRKIALETFLESLPPMSNLSDKARELRSFLQNHRIGSGKIQFTPERKEGLSLWKYTTTLSAYGTYADIKGFLADIARSPSLFCIEHFTLAKGSKQGQVHMGLRIATYCR